MSLDNIWDEPVASPPNPSPTDGDASPQKRPRQSLFLSGSDSDGDYTRPPKRAMPARPDVDALFADLDGDGEDDDLRYKPIAPALDLEKLAKEAESRHQVRGVPSQAFAGASKTWAGAAGKDEGKGKGGGGGGATSGDGETKTRKALPKLDEERLVGSEGFPLLIEGIRGFKGKGKGHEHADLNQLLQIYQFWTHRMFPKMSFKDTIDRVERLCHSKRMQSRLSVWRDEFKGVANDKQPADDPDVIDLTEPTVVADDDDEVEPEIPQPKGDQATSSRTPSLPPASSEADDDDFDIDAVIRAEEERLSALRTSTGDSGVPRSVTLVGKTPSRNVVEADVMDVDEAGLWNAFDDPPLLPLLSGPSVPARDDDDMWDVVDEIEQSGPANTQPEVPVSGVNLIPSLDNTTTTSGGSASRATNDDDWDEMYS